MFPFQSYTSRQTRAIGPRGDVDSSVLRRDSNESTIPSVVTCWFECCLRCTSDVRCGLGPVLGWRNSRSTFWRGAVFYVCFWLGVLCLPGIGSSDHRQQDGHAQCLARLDSDWKSHLDAERGEETIVVVSPFSNSAREPGHGDHCLDGRGRSCW